MRLLSVVPLIASVAGAFCGAAATPRELNLGEVRIAHERFSFNARIEPRQEWKLGIKARLFITGKGEKRRQLLDNTQCFLEIQDNSERPVDTVEEAESTHSEASMASSCKSVNPDSCEADLKARRTLARDLEPTDPRRIGVIASGVYSVRVACAAFVGSNVSAGAPYQRLLSEWVKVDLAR